MMQQSPRRPPKYPTPGFVPPSPATPNPPRTPAAPQPTASRAASPPPPPTTRAQRDVVVRSTGIKLLSVLGILHASMILMALVVVLVMALGGDARVGLVITTIKNASLVLWTWTLFAIFTSVVLGFVMLYNAIATLSLTPWSARAMKLWSGVWLALSAVAIVINLAWVYPLLREASPDRFSVVRTLLATALHLSAGVIWPGLVLLYMNTRQVKQTYARIAGGASTM